MLTAQWEKFKKLSMSGMHHITLCSSCRVSHRKLAHSICNSAPNACTSMQTKYILLSASKCPIVRLRNMRSKHWACSDVQAIQTVSLH